MPEKKVTTFEFDKTYDDDSTVEIWSPEIRFR